jgi:phosphoribosylanthranilate isomerase
MFRIKICGLAGPEDARRVAESGADAIGLNFYPKSLRHVSVEQAREIAAAAGGLLKVGLFVNERPEVIREVATAVGLDCLQLHGDESVQVLKELEPWRVIKGLRLGAANLPDVLEAAQRWLELGAKAILIDALQRSGEYGGGGVTGDWEAAHELVARMSGPVILAGGLDPQNVAAAILRVGPSGVDTASGVERFPGKKDAELMARFVEAAKLAWGQRES